MQVQNMRNEVDELQKNLDEEKHDKQLQSEKVSGNLLTNIKFVDPITKQYRNYRS